MEDSHNEQFHVPQKKRTIVKDRVGCVRTSVYSLPTENHTYGRPTEYAAEGSGDCKPPEPALALPLQS